MIEHSLDEIWLVMDHCLSERTPAILVQFIGVNLTDLKQQSGEEVS